MEASLMYETGASEILSPSEFLSCERLHLDGASADHIRRLYPITLLGPVFARQVDPVQLRTAGAVDVTPIRDSLQVQEYPSSARDQLGAVATRVPMLSTSYLDRESRLAQFVPVVLVPASSKEKI